MKIVPAFLVVALLITGVSQRTLANVKEQIDSLVSRSFTLSYSDPKLAVEIGRRALQLADDSEYGLGAYNSRYSIAYALANSGDVPQAMNFYLEAISEGEKSDDPEIRNVLGSICIEAGVILRNHLMYTESNQMFGKALAIFNAIDSKHGMARAYDHMSRTLRNVKDYEEALIEIEKSVDLAFQDSNQLIQLSVLNGKGLILTKLGRYGEAQNVFREMIGQISDKTLRREMYLGLANDNLGYAYFKEMKFGLAEEHLAISIGHHENSNFNEVLFSALINASEIHAGQEKFDQAYKYGKRAYDMYEEIPLVPEYFKLFNIMTQAAHAIGKVDEALAYSMKYHEVNEQFRAHQDEIMRISQEVETVLIAAGFYQEFSPKETNFSRIVLMIVTPLFFLLLIGNYIRQKMIKFKVEKEVSDILNKF